MTSKYNTKGILLVALVVLFTCYILLASSPTVPHQTTELRPVSQSSRNGPISNTHAPSWSEQQDNLAASEAHWPSSSTSSDKYTNRDPSTAPSERDDIHCNSQPNAGAVMACRVRAAKAKAETWCREMDHVSNGTTSVYSISRSFKQVRVRAPLLPYGHRDHGDWINLAVEPSKDIVSNKLAEGSGWELALMTKLMYNMHNINKTVTPTTVGLLDIGANFGWYTFVASAHGYPVIAFEAMKRNQQAMWTTMCLNPWVANYVTFFTYAPSPDEQECRMWSDRVNVADGHLLCGAADQLIAQEQGLEPHDAVHTVKLDDYLPDTPVHFVMKIDVEGSEAGVITGGESAIRERVKYAVSEVAPKGLREKGSSAEEYLTMWRDMGFEMDDSVSLFPGAFTTVAEYVESHPITGDVFFRKKWPEVHIEDDCAIRWLGGLKCNIS